MGSNAHVIGDEKYFVSVQTIESSKIHDISSEVATKVAGVGTVSIVTEVDGKKIQTFVDDVLYVPGAQ
ncbi:hypothetical protein PsorP6_016409 [Peronosclerospora sorghi]|uniref:Uncharacterized protein n=1 Tax=Peronosclerospora sorghi TaxID=230839 RepID=A0ACC0VLP1_9STRA|nr:hypothetical protein PsorP6_016409 [Peronosclerospora sorghi]